MIDLELSNISNKGCYSKTRFCKKKKKRNCKKSCSDSSGSFKCLKAKNGKFTTLSGTKLNVTSSSVFSKLNLTNDTNNNIPTFVSTSFNVVIPSLYTSMSSVYIFTSDTASKTVTFNKFSSAFNGVRLVFINGTSSTFTNTNTFAVTSSDTISTGGGSGNIPLLSAGESVEYIGSWNSATNVMTFYKIR